MLEAKGPAAGSLADSLLGGAMALGNFDGVHLGHQALFRKAVEAAGHARAAAFTFHPHPGKVLQPELAPKLITLLPRKLELFADYGLSAVVVQPFTQEYAATAPETFEQALFRELKLKHVVVGGDFTYGRQREGTVETLAAAASAAGATLHRIAPLTVDGVVISSSRVREYILEGRLGAARKLLGRPFDLDGVVVTGKGRGRGIGFPTANVDTLNELRPSPGVYAVRVAQRGPAPGSVPAGPWLPGAANIGVKPTFGGSEVTVEVHLIDFSGDLYGKELRVQFLDRLRAEQRFGSPSELALQIQRDVESARAVIARHVDQAVT